MILGPHAYKIKKKKLDWVKGTWKYCIKSIGTSNGSQFFHKFLKIRDKWSYGIWPHSHFGPHKTMNSSDHENGTHRGPERQILGSYFFANNLKSELKQRLKFDSLAVFGLCLLKAFNGSYHDLGAHRIQINKNEKPD